MCAKKQPAFTTDTLAPSADRVPATSTLKLCKAVLIYEETLRKPLQHGHFVHGRQLPERVITVSDVLDEQGRLGQPQLIDPVAFADSILDAHHREDRETLVFQPSNILAQGRDAIVWWRPAAPAKLYFKLAETKDESRYTALNGREVVLPSLVFRGSSRGLMVWALAEIATRPTPETKLYGAPFMNIGGGGPQVCLGSARSADLRDATARAAAPVDWERMFFESNFTHTPPTLSYSEEIKDYPSLLEHCAAFAAQDKVGQDGFAPYAHPVPCLFPVQLLRPCKSFPTLAAAIAGRGA